MNDKVSKVPIAMDPESIPQQFIALIEIIEILRRECPWDSKQTNESIAHLMIEEVYETIDSIHKKDDEEFSKELGDLLLHIIMHSVMAEERGAFSILDVIKKIQHKLVYRHPHVFGNVEVSGEDEVMQNWEALKLKEKKVAGSILDGVPLTLPSLLRAERIQHKASRVGFDWDNSDDVWKKVEEELDEFRRELISGDILKATNELGDLLFAIVNAARFQGLVAEEALQFTNNKFTKRFNYIEQKVRESGKDMNNLSLEEMDAIWDMAKIDIG